MLSHLFYLLIYLKERNRLEHLSRILGIIYKGDKQIFQAHTTSMKTCKKHIPFKNKQTTQAVLFIAAIVKSKINTELTVFEENSFNPCFQYFSKKL
jgi:hypothetical protein